MRKTVGDFVLNLRSIGLGALVVIVAIMFATNGYSHHAQYYVLDGFGGVHAGGGAAAAPAGIPYFGFDIAKDIAYVPDDAGDGLLVLDGFGGVHVAALGNVSPATPYFGFDIARAITYRNIPPRAANSSSTTLTDLDTSSSSFTTLASTTIYAPDDGFVLVIATTYVSCVTSSADLGVKVTINIDATTEPSAITAMGTATWDDCQSGGGGLLETSNQTVTHLFSVSAGLHTVNLLGRKVGGTGTARFLGRSLTAVFIDHGSTGASDPRVSSLDIANADRANSQ